MKCHLFSRMPCAKFDVYLTDLKFDDGQLSFLDDGCGMDKKEIESIISFGYSAKRMDPEMVGQYGNGLKSAAMRIGKDVLILTKKEGLLTCMLISRSFLEANNLRKVIVPTPSFLEDGTAYYETMSEMDKHTLEVNIIYKYSPFESHEHLMQQFERIHSETGTLVICYNLRRIEGGQFEMDFNTDKFDVRLSQHIPQRENERNSLRAYLAVLYAKPRMRVFIRGEKVDTKRILSALYKPRMYQYQARNLKACAERELQDCQKKVVELTDTVALNKSEVANFEVAHPNFMTDSTLRIHHRTLIKAVDVATEMLCASELRLKKLARAKSNPSPLVFYFGLNIHHRNQYGCMLYNNGRLIRMYEKVANQKERNDRMLKYLGVVAVVDVPCSVLAPAHSKQSFENPREYANLMKAINDYMEQYWNDTAIEATPGGVANFWRPFGYKSMEWNAEPSNETEYIRKRYSCVGYSLQCDNCLKWRHLQFQQNYLSEGIPKNWNCSMHPNSIFRNCSKLEELPPIPKGRLMWTIKSSLTPTAKKDSSASNRKVLNKTPVARKRLPTPPARSRRGRQRSVSSSDDDEKDTSPSPPPTRTSLLMKKSTAEEEPPKKRKSLARTKASLSSGRITRRSTLNGEQQTTAEDSEVQIIEEKDLPMNNGRSASSADLSLKLNDERRTEEVNEKKSIPLPLTNGSELSSNAPQSSTTIQDESERNASASSQNCKDENANEIMSKDISEKVALKKQRDGLLRKLNDVLEFCRESSFPKINFGSADEALTFDLQDYFRAHREGVEMLINKQVTNRLRNYLESAVKVMKWADPEVADEISSENVMDKMVDFTKLI
ncbi:unnamed protein product [Anisakis simplex]|uniref:MORC family CW-type zinc finger protein 2 (inferred by orthology to a human protein) n=1 Tax=Anisakis simplex TaxID=6269 RepID=A0A0M3JZ70_ANISI|nr:unnamed protein product [Anisakis simplex]